MAIHVALTHRTAYHFDRPVTVHPHVVRLRPAPHTRTPILQYSLRVEPEEHFLNWQQDPFGNHLARLVFPEPVTRLEVTVDLLADMTRVNPFDFFLAESAERHPFDYGPRVFADLGPYLETVEPGPLLADLLTDLRAELDPARHDDGDGMRTIDMLVHVNQRLSRDIAYTTRLEAGVQTPEQTLDAALGSCRDTGWLLVHVLRHLGYAARFVSGYLVQLAADDQDPLDGPAGPAEDFTDLHAWCEVYVPGAGWIGLDPTSGLFAGEGHIPLAATPEPASAAPIEGATGVADVRFDFANLVRREHEDPRVTLPYTPEQRAAIDALGRDVDRRLVDGDVRLTMGGEPTFISVDDPEEPEWTTAADGGHKRELAWDLTQRLADRFAPGALLRHGQGKWYPGEPLPRWELGVVWRPDGQPVWSDRALLADPFPPARPRPVAEAEPEAQVEVEVDPSLARRLLSEVARRLGMGDDLVARRVVPAWEDRLHDLWQDATRPDGPPAGLDPDPAEPLSDDELASMRATVDARGADGDPAGWLLPLFRTPAQDGWATTTWRLRRGRVVLTPGDSPLGLRLPIGSLGWEPPDEPEESSFAEHGRLPDHDDLPGLGQVVDDLRGRADSDHAGSDDVLDVPANTPGTPTTALSVECRGGLLHVFLPPIAEAEAWLELVAAVEAGAAAVGTAVVVEGYGPPGDPRLRTLTVTPDPGVIEVNVQPTTDWDGYVELTEGLYEDARLARLTTERFDIDGSHTGTGGGNHITLGGPTPRDSPLLRRPDLLVSLLTYWQRHPSLSYLFSSKFVGPTSQAPRVDEARTDRLHELSIAFAELDRLRRRDERLAAADAPVWDGDGEPPQDQRDHDGPPRAPAWRVDRALRHLLTDLTGNTHRAEFCIDKLYSPDSERGRLGLLELRGFEMPPHPEMAMVQALLVRAIVARCWEEPYDEPLVEWGSLLHDRWLLPHWVEADIDDVTADLRAHGIDLPAAWMRPFTEFRFPRLGSTTVAGVALELRGAIEPWEVLGEEATAGGTARYVDSSVERLQVTVRGLVPGRHVLTCNGRPVPLHPTGAGSGVAGVRFKAWSPWSALHPSIEVQAPLTFDVVDLELGRSLGGCRYHVVHPGGRAYEDAPVNAAAAESRRSARFEAMGHTPGSLEVASLRAAVAAGADATFPVTLDLRAPAG